MKRLFSGFLTAISVAVLIVAPVNRVSSCGPSLDPDVTRFMLFKQELTDLDGLISFNYTQHFLYGSNTPWKETDNHRNQAEWIAITGNHAKAKDIDDIQNYTEPEKFLYAVKAGKWENLETNTFIKWLRRKENRDYLEYMAFAKRVEFEQYGDHDPWKDDEGKFHKPGYDSLAVVAMAKCKEPLSKFLKERYAFQAVKLLHYAGMYNAAAAGKMERSDGVDKDDARLIRCYDTYLKGKTTIVADWGLLYYGFAFRSQTKRALYLLQAFDRCEDKKQYIYNHLSAKDVKKLEQVTTDPKMLVVINAYKAIKNPGRALKEMQLIYKYDPGSKYLPLLAGREVNKLEDWILSPQVQGFNSVMRETLYEKEKEGRRSGGDDTSYGYFTKKNIEKDKVYGGEVRSFLESLVNGNRPSADFFKLAIVHLYHIEGNYAAAKSYLAALPYFTDPGYEAQCNIEKAISLIYTADVRSETVKQQLEKVFTQLEAAGVRTDTSREYSFEDENKKDMMSELYLMLSLKLKERGDIVTGGLVFQQARIVVNDYFGVSRFYSENGGSTECYGSISWVDKFGATKDIDSLLWFKHKKKKTAFERRITPVAWASDDFYKDLKGTILIRQGKFEEALAVMNAMPDDFWVKHYEYKEYLRRSSVTSVGTLLPVATGSGIKYPLESKKLILREIAAVRAAIKIAHTDSARAALNFMLGNCLYNISYHGKDWMMYSYGKTTRETYGNYGENWAYYTFYPNSEKYGKTYYECTDAIKTYKLALKYAGNNNELAAQCLLMLSICDRAASTFNGQSVYNNYVYHQSDDEQKTFYSSYMKTLKKKYAKTKVFRVSATECPDVAEYLKKYGS